MIPKPKWPEWAAFGKKGEVTNNSGTVAEAAAGKALGVDFVMEPDLVRTPLYAAHSAGWFWDTQKLNALAEAGNNIQLTKKINGGTIGLEDRIHHTNLALQVLTA